MAATILPMFIWKLTSEGGSWLDPSNPLIPEAQTMVLCTMVMFELFRLFACRSDVHSLFKLGVFSNKWLIWSALSSFGLLFIVLYSPFLQGPFHVAHMGPEDWILMAPISISGFITVEIIKLVYRRIDKKARAIK